jgi:ADP-heptose:LPS heptosyltransferase
MRWNPEGTDPPRKILLIQFRRIGDAVLITPALDAVREAWPEARVHLLAEDPVPELFRGDPRVQVVWRRPPRTALLRLVRRLRRERYDLVVDFQNLPLSAFLARATGGYSVGFRRRLRTPFYHRAVDLGAHRGSDYTADHKLDLLRSLGPVPSALMPRLHPPAPDPVSWEGLGNGPRIALVPVSPWAHKRWAPEAFAETARILHRETGAVFVLAGGPGEEDTLAAVSTGLGRVPHRCREFSSLSPFLSLLGGADLFLGNDSGPRHMAIALGVPTVAFFGPHDPAQWTPPRTDRHPVLWNPPAGWQPARDGLTILPPEPRRAAAAAARLLDTADPARPL